MSRGPGPRPDDHAPLDPELEPDPDRQHHARATLPHACLVAAGGTIGTLARDLLLGALPQGNYAIPWTLICLNIIGAALLGVLASRFLDLHPHRHGPRLFLATGVLGGFTTYSSLVSAAVVDGHHNHLDIAFITLLATSIVGVVAAWLAGRTRRSELA